MKATVTSDNKIKLTPETWKEATLLAQWDSEGIQVHVDGSGYRGGEWDQALYLVLEFVDTNQADDDEVTE